MHNPVLWIVSFEEVGLCQDLALTTQILNPGPAVSNICWGNQGHYTRMTVFRASQPTLIYQYVIYSPGLLIPGGKELNKEKSQHQPIWAREARSLEEHLEALPHPHPAGCPMPSTPPSISSSTLLRHSCLALLSPGSTQGRLEVSLHIHSFFPESESPVPHLFTPKPCPGHTFSGTLSPRGKPGQAKGG